MFKKYSNGLKCFSPPVMLATFILEFSFAVYVIFRYRLNDATRLIVCMLILLGTFQLTEYMICGGLGLGHKDWAQLGYVAITLLPVLGLHLVMVIAKKYSKILLALAYATAIAYVAYFILAGDSVVGRVCRDNYAVFDISGWGYPVYAAYYYGWLLVSIVLALIYTRKNAKFVPILRWLILGYVLFIVPTAAVTLFLPHTSEGIPSIMCGFAVILALILTLRVAPLYNKLNSKTKKRSTKTKK